MAFALVLSFTDCKSSSKRDYFDTSFQCFAEPGWRDNANFKKYIEKAWLPTRLLYAEDNLKIKKSEIVFTGDSLVHLFLPDLIAKEFPGQTVTNRGIGGDMTETLLTRIEEDVLVLRPEKVVIEIGGNDFIQGKCLSLVQNNLISIIQTIHTRNRNIKIFLMAVPPTRVRELNQIVPVFNLFLNQVARSTNNVEYIEVWDKMRKIDSPTLSEEFIRPNGDNLHFNEKGYELWGKKLRPYLKK
ncbi:GDSL-type esterase/lipase family protein [Leptospira sp. 2 VSF19]|uniref:GDSL-type esterase/lipase family protein n=1 Tax=Leptospira soteropolitanensis TaxID=2950025 RepID=A0AAW5VGF2_9LEPT|nr:GDSL-type esterase/lipase family protein [Leptospira soteropolitanensis]MCW7494197.1 GDSL-type esterase/lipase family protein [Leptospira soteropolitanensis]MCW7501828.1 GDSL-type esterase/lipase family protein [Leptospira soteropolitanensis]MCW7524043.1 GDSL-type esterase/lipase family protein [Leptospira soteropolitanensis]MCW7527908.1 GDSL-type esterase/lipase family protein [Leptospira soteropolitanensis]MCW7531798.1 GDSL-type esterase/lipase family protein [Leptospira soteropolitanensi